MAYVAGFGTAGSLLAGAAMVFTLASAVVAFNGWPQIGSQPNAAAVLVSHQKTSTPLDAQALQRMRAASAAVAASSAGPGATSRGGGSASIAGQPGRSAGSVVPSTSAGGSGRGHRGLGNPTSPTTAPTGGCTNCGGASSPTVGGTVASTTGALGGAVRNVTSKLGTTVGSLNPTLGSAVTRTGNTVATLVQHTSATVNQTLGHVLGGH